MANQTQELSIRNKYVFAEVMRNKEICKGFLQRVLPEISIGELVYIESEKTIDAAPDSHGIRVDVYAEDGDHIYDIEMQVRNEGDLPWRSRYGAALLDEMSLDRGREYTSLRESFVIFLCLFDPFGRDRRKYTFRNFCEEEQDLPLADGVTRIFLNTKGTRGEIPRQLQNFLDYVDGNAPLDGFMKDVDKAVHRAGAKKETRAMIAKWEIERNSELGYARREGLEKGLAEGIEQGKEQERRNTEKERKRAEAAEQKLQELTRRIEALEEELRRRS